MLFGMDVYETGLVLVFYFISTLINAWFCYLVWKYRAGNGGMVKAFNSLLSQTEVGRSINNISLTIDTLREKYDTVNENIDKVKSAVDKFEIPTLDIDEDSMVGKLWARIKGKAGGDKKALNEEISGIESDVSQIAEMAYPGCIWMAENLDFLVDTGWIGKDKADAFTRAARHPTVLPTLEKGCAWLKNKVDNATETPGAGSRENNARPKF